MLLRALPDLLRDPAQFLLLFPLLIATVGGALLIGITVHEFSHARVASTLGDPTARRLGRLSLNPLAHLDPTGTLMLLIVGFGWGKPVPVNPLLLRNGRSGMALVSLAGPAANLATAALCAIPLRTGLLPLIPLSRPLLNLNGVEQALGYFLGLVLFYNLVLALFNLIPLAPLDGAKVVLGLLPPNAARSFARLQPYGPGILMLVIFLDIFIGVGILSRILFPLLDGLTLFLVGRPLL